jgi:hypothetical protein
MSTTSMRTSASAEDLWDVLADGWAYAAWVVGASRVRAVADTWPQTGSRIHHSVGVWPVLINDHTEVEAVEPGRRLLLRAQGWPAGMAKVDIRLEPASSGCTVTIIEDAVSGPATFIPQPVRRILLDARNREALRRLDLLAQGRARRQT